MGGSMGRQVDGQIRALVRQLAHNRRRRIRTRLGDREPVPCTLGQIPTPLAVNPTLTGAALAIRTADNVPADRRQGA